MDNGKDKDADVTFQSNIKKGLAGDLIAAMEVEAEMIATYKFAIRITRLTPHPDLEAPNWTVEFMRYENLERIHVEEHANTLPEAICLAALEAVK